MIWPDSSIRFPLNSLQSFQVIIEGTLGKGITAYPFDIPIGQSRCFISGV